MNGAMMNRGMTAAAQGRPRGNNRCAPACNGGPSMPPAMESSRPQTCPARRGAALLAILDVPAERLPEWVDVLLSDGRFDGLGGFQDFDVAGEALDKVGDGRGRRSRHE
jgi:hypothetical protein